MSSHWLEDRLFSCQIKLLQWPMFLPQKNENVCKWNIGANVVFLVQPKTWNILSNCYPAVSNQVIRNLLIFLLHPGSVLQLKATDTTRAIQHNSYNSSGDKWTQSTTCNFCNWLIQYKLFNSYSTYLHHLFAKFPITEITLIMDIMSGSVVLLTMFRQCSVGDVINSKDDCYES